MDTVDHSLTFLWQTHNAIAHHIVIFASAQQSLMKCASLTAHVLIRQSTNRAEKNEQCGKA